ncbi:MAG TPA: hypothetical protein DCS97_00100 [Planctomycetes bacterium]|nr:hypothetical protein [Planctomycetota bacterium]
MIVKGTIIKSGRWYVVEAPALDLHTQGRSKAEALRMAEAWVRDMLDKQDLDVTATADDTGAGFGLRCADAAVLVGLVLHRRRTAAGLSMREVADRLGSKSPNTYARYESGQTMPSVAQLDRLLAAVGSELVMAG